VALPRVAFPRVSLKGGILLANAAGPKFVCHAGLL
jgi:hypothetical protein